MATFTRAVQRNLKTLTKATVRSRRRAAASLPRAARRPRTPPTGPGDWIGGMALGPAGARAYHLFCPAGLKLQSGERLPLLVMLHGCGQSGRDFAASTRMNRLAARERCLVLYPEQDRLANVQGCWNWYERRSGKAVAEAATLMAMIDQVLLLYPADRARVALVGLSAGASMAALLAAHYPSRFQAAAMHSGVAPGAAQSGATALSAMQGLRSPAVVAAATVGKAVGAALHVAHLPALLVVHGDADRVVAPSNASASAQSWALASGASPGPTRTLQRGKRYAMRITDYRRQGQVVVTLCQIEGLGHAWSGGPAKQPFSDAAGPDATRLVWGFVARQFKAAAARA